MKSSPSNELLAASSTFYPTSDQKSSAANHKGNLTSTDIDTLKLKEIEDLKVERIKKKSEKQMQQPSSINKTQKSGSGADSNLQDSDDYIDLKDCFSKKGYNFKLFYLFFVGMIIYNIFNTKKT